MGTITACTENQLHGNTGRQLPLPVLQLWACSIELKRERRQERKRRDGVKGNGMGREDRAGEGRDASGREGNGGKGRDMQEQMYGVLFQTSA